jgi:hypothetical protein
MTPDRYAADGTTPADCVLVDGNTPVRQPNLNFTISPSYHGELGSSGWGYNARLDWRRSGSNYMDDVNLMKMPDTDILNLSLSFSNEMFNVRLYANNLTDDDTPSAIGYGADWNQAVNGSIDNLYILGRRPREFGVRLQVDF